MIDEDLPQYAAASLLEWAQRNGGGFSDDLESVVKIPGSVFEWDVPAAVTLEAVNILCDIGVGSTSSDKHAGTFFSIEKGSFQDFWSLYKIQKEKADELDGEDVVFDYESEISKLKAFVAMENYPIVQRYGRFGGPWINKAIESLRTTETASADATSTGKVDSSTWTGRAPKAILDEEGRQRLLELLNIAERELEELRASNHEKALARTFIVASRVLAEAPEPHDDLVWEMVSRANSISGIASLFVSIMSLFAAVAT